MPVTTQTFNSSVRLKEILLSVKLCYFSPEEIRLRCTAKKVGNGSSVAAQTELLVSRT